MWQSRIEPVTKCNRNLILFGRGACGVREIKIGGGDVRVRAAPLRWRGLYLRLLNLEKRA